jgi:hypothetical protein
MDIRSRDQCVPPSASLALWQSLMGRNTCVVRVKFGRASRRVRGSGVWSSMKDMLGRRRTMFEFLNRVKCSRSRYLRKSACSWVPRFWSHLLFPESYHLRRISGYSMTTELASLTLSVNQSFLSVCMSSLVTIPPSVRLVWRPCREKHTSNVVIWEEHIVLAAYPKRIYESHRRDLTHSSDMRHPDATVGS